jgi:YVTN family beta-propeller protein
MKKILFAILIAATTNITVAESNFKAFIPNTISGDLSVINTTTQTQSNLITLPLGSYYSASVSPSGNVAYTADINFGKVYPIDTTTNAIGTPITVGTSPVNITFNTAGTKAYVSNYDSDTISVIDVSTFSVTSTITTTGCINPAQSVVWGTDLLVTCTGNDTIFDFIKSE